jgi:predicted HicB family RNase H-like nuclease
MMGPRSGRDFDDLANDYRPEPKQIGRFDRLSVRLPTKLKQKIQKAADAERRSLSDYICIVLEKAVE